MVAPKRRQSTDIRGEELRSRRVMRRVSLSELGREAGVSKHAIWWLERRGQFASAAAARRYLAALQRVVDQRATRTRLLMGITWPVTDPVISGDPRSSDDRSVCSEAPVDWDPS